MERPVSTTQMIDWDLAISTGTRWAHPGPHGKPGWAGAPSPRTTELASAVQQPVPARYTEASLVKEFEAREIGRPSTYASIIGTILDRGYVFKKGTALVPSFLAFAVVTLLERHFGQLVDYEFTARMEDALDEIARGEAERIPWLRRFYFGTDDPGHHDPGLKALVSDIGDIDARDVSSFHSQAATLSSASAGTARTWSGTGSVPTCPRTWRPTS